MPGRPGRSTSKMVAPPDSVASPETTWGAPPASGLAKTALRPGVLAPLHRPSEEVCVKAQNVFDFARFQPAQWSGQFRRRQGIPSIESERAPSRAPAWRYTRSGSSFKNAPIRTAVSYPSRLAVTDRRFGEAQMVADSMSQTTIL